MGERHTVRPVADGIIERTTGVTRPAALSAALMALLLIVAGCSSSSHTPSTVSAPPLLVRPTITITPSPGAAVAPAAPVVVKAAGGILTNVSVFNPAKPGSQIPGALSDDKATWTSTAPLAYGATYHVVADAANIASGGVEQTAEIHTVSPDTLAFPSLIPAPGVSDSYGVGQIFGVSFDEPVADKAAAVKALSVVSNPPQPGAWYWMDDQTVHYRPQTYWQPNTTVTISANVYGVSLGGGVYGQVNRTATYKIHDAWIAKADGRTEKMDIFHNNQLIKTMPISLGSPQYPSHVGPHVISDKQPSVVMDSCTYGVCAGQPGYYKETVYLDERISNDGEFVHSAPWSVGQQGSDNVSHGCVNLSPDNAQWFFDHFNLGDVVEISNSGGPPLPVWDTYGDWELTWQQWLAGGPNA
jgi:lipoprotein-anchoring transpeptidase ErfK/SrfK